MPPRVNQKNLTQPLRPAARYRPGKGVQVDEESDSDEQVGDEQQQAAEDEDDVGLTSISNTTTEAPAKKRQVNVSLGQVAVDRTGKLLNRDGRSPSPPPPAPQAKAVPSSEYETDSDDEEEEEESEEEEPAKPLYKPVFVSKRNRDTIAEREKEFDPELQEQKRLQEIEERKKQAHNFVADTIMREIAEKQADSKQHDVDDTDGLDPEGEFEAWKLRELTRLKRDRELELAREKEREQVEARRSMPEPLRLKEDLEYAQKTRDEKKRGQQAFLQKYHHKGAFYTDSDVLQKHDYSAPTLSTHTQMENMPKILQNKNFGKRSQTKYTHLVAEDTSSKQAGWSSRPGQSSSKPMTCFHCGGPHLKKDCPQLAADVQRDRDGGWDRRRERRDDRSGRPGSSPPPPRRRSRSRSRSPPRREDDRYRNRDGDRDRRGIGAREDKRRRVEY